MAALTFNYTGSFVDVGGGLKRLAEAIAGAESDYLPVIGGGQVFHVEKTGSDSNNGILVGEGGTGPWLTIQKAAQTLTAGQTVEIGAGTYSEPDPILGSSYWYGIRPKNSGTAGNQITYMAAAGASVIIDQGVNGTPQNINGVWGISILGKTHLNFIGLEVRNCWRSGIETHSGFPTENAEIYIHKCNIHNVRFTNAQNTGGLRPDFCNGFYVTDSKIHDVYTEGTEHHNAPAVMTYQGRNMHFCNNEIYDCYAPIYQKKHTEINPSKCFTFRRNLIHDVNFGFRTNNNASQPVTCYGYDALMEENIIYNLKTSGYGTHDETHYATAQSRKWIFRNNTIISSPEAAIQAGLYIRGWKEAQCYNNVFFNSTGATGTTILAAYFDNNQLTEISPYFMPGLDYSDFNLFSHEPTIKIGTGSTEGITYNTLAAWRSALIATQKGITGMITQPDLNSVVGTPTFVNAGADDYRLDGGSLGIGIGKDGKNMGAQPLGTEVIGVRP